VELARKLHVEPKFSQVDFGIPKWILTFFHLKPKIPKWNESKFPKWELKSSLGLETKMTKYASSHLIVILNYTKLY
jgi:hypothetical protein